MAACLACAAIHDGSASMVSSPDKDASISRVFQDTEDTRIDGLDPDHLAVTGLARECRDQQLLIAIPKQNLAHTSQLAKLTEDACDGFLDLAVRCLLDAFVFGADVTDGNLGQHQATAHLLSARLHRALSQQTDLELAQRRPVIASVGCSTISIPRQRSSFSIHSGI